MQLIANKLIQILSDIRQAEYTGGRQQDSVTLLAVSKTKPAEDLVIAYQQGQRHFGESYLQEALRKQSELAHFNITWHFIGPIQSNKTRLIAKNFSWAHSVDRLKIAKRLHEQRPENFPPLNICLQVNISKEESKSGVLLEDLPHLINEVRQLPRIRLRGVMAIPSSQQDYDQQRLPYRQIVQAVKQLNDQQLDTFSFGMSGDLKAAIVEGATIVRVGTGLFGERT
jgi:pyridoxal phosphate enzyme (YggS family)